jgi:hypothetical protein
MLYVLYQALPPHPSPPLSTGQARNDTICQSVCQESSKACWLCQLFGHTLADLVVTKSTTDLSAPGVVVWDVLPFTGAKWWP